MSLKVITVAQQKGGAGKTTIAAHLAVALVQKGFKVALIDIDQQRSWQGLHGNQFY
jgi:chromosome partitioning protein